MYSVREYSFIVWHIDIQLSQHHWLKTLYFLPFNCPATLVKSQLPGLTWGVRWIWIHPLMQGTRVQSLVQEDPACRRAENPGQHNCWATCCSCCGLWAQSLCWTRNPPGERPATISRPHAPQLGGATRSHEDPAQPK